MRQDIEKDGTAGLPDLLGFGRSDHAYALESGRCWRTIVFCPVSHRFGYVLARRRHGRPQEHDKRAPDEPVSDGCHDFLVTRSLLMGCFSRRATEAITQKVIGLRLSCSHPSVQFAIQMLI